MQKGIQTGKVVRERKTLKPNVMIMTIHKHENYREQSHTNQTIVKYFIIEVATPYNSDGVNLTCHRQIGLHHRLLKIPYWKGISSLHLLLSLAE